MFSPALNPTFSHPVKVRVPVDGGYEEHSFKATFNVLPVEVTASFDLSKGDDSTAFLKRVVHHMDDIGDEDGNPVQYNDAVRDRMISLPYVRIALSAAYWSGISGQALGN